MSWIGTEIQAPVGLCLSYQLSFSRSGVQLIKTPVIVTTLGLAALFNCIAMHNYMLNKLIANTKMELHAYSFLLVRYTVYFYVQSK